MTLLRFRWIIRMMMQKYDRLRTDGKHYGVRYDNAEEEEDDDDEPHWHHAKVSKHH